MVAANMSGELQLKIEADDVTATTFFRELQNHIFGGWFLSHLVGSLRLRDISTTLIYRLKEMELK